MPNFLRTVTKCFGWFQAQLSTTPCHKVMLHAIGIIMHFLSCCTFRTHFVAVLQHCLLVMLAGARWFPRTSWRAPCKQGDRPWADFCNGSGWAFYTLRYSYENRYASIFDFEVVEKKYGIVSCFDTSIRIFGFSMVYSTFSLDISWQFFVTVAVR